MAVQELHCPSCGLAHPLSERFCESCGMPLVSGEGEEADVSDRQRQARKIKPQYTEGPLVRVARARNLVEGELLAGLLLEEGIPSTLSSSVAGHGPLAGARDVLVPESAAQAAREALAPPDPGGWIEPAPPEDGD